VALATTVRAEPPHLVPGGQGRRVIARGQARLASAPARNNDRALPQRLRFRPLKPRRLPLRLNERAGRSFPALA
jgi:hypothetical protein